ncbi:hypothetical protein SGM_2414 [Streptomyces griseoaurantiacus M045]|uniref:Uncharacterized protein n=1 Tax=Streptomyces griseoaurantiacus M045 TaxID=996637 RepID=F3NH00_9ACTN|nr:hypothetical protein SGM_2414 [Streptomyces griseoaurantiacus M045]
MWGESGVERRGERADGEAHARRLTQRALSDGSAELGGRQRGGRAVVLSGRRGRGRGRRAVARAGPAGSVRFRCEGAGRPG